MNFILITVSSEKSSLLKELLDNKILNEIGFSAEFDSTNLIYDNVLIPYVENTDDEDFLLNKHRINISDKYKYSVYLVFKDAINKYNIDFKFIREINEDQFDISYTDGSYSKNNDKASFGCCKLISKDPNGTEDYFTKEKYLYETFNGEVKPATNNVGEVTGIKICVENFSNKTFQLIISDSIYAIKSFREWIYNWQKNGYKGKKSKKGIKNKELIIDTWNTIRNSGKIIIYKWTKGHDGDNFNEICDQLAKDISGGK